MTNDIEKEVRVILTSIADECVIEDKKELEQATASIMGLVEREKESVSKSFQDNASKNYISQEELEREYIHRSKIGIQEAVIECDTVCKICRILLCIQS